jgi:hypothetical protein
MSETKNPPSNYVSALVASWGGLNATSYGVEGGSTVAVQCLTGYTPGKHFIFNGSVEGFPVYDGMKSAFGAENEILTPEFNHFGESLPRPLTTNDYDKILMAAMEKNERHQKLLSAVPPGHPSLARSRFNGWVRDEQWLPLWEWSLTKYGLKTFAYAFLALGLMPTTFAIRALCGADLRPDICYVAIFFLTSLWVTRFLEVNRAIYYVRIKRTDLSSQLAPQWDRLFQGSELWHRPMSSGDAIEDLRKGHVRWTEMPLEATGQQTKMLLIPVMALWPDVGGDSGDLWLTASPIRNSLLGMGYLFTSNPSHTLWASLYALTASLQASAQRLFAARFLREVRPRGIVWFQKMAGVEYEIVHKDRDKDWVFNLH